MYDLFAYIVNLDLHDLVSLYLNELKVIVDFVWNF